MSFEELAALYGIQKPTSLPEALEISTLLADALFMRYKDVSARKDLVAPQVILAKTLEAALLKRTIKDETTGSLNDATITSLLQLNDALEKAGITLTGIANNNTYNLRHLFFGAPDITHSEQDALLEVVARGKQAEKKIKLQDGKLMNCSFEHCSLMYFTQLSII